MFEIFKLAFIAALCLLLCDKAASANVVIWTVNLILEIKLND